ncbi:MAG TPA: OB-fold domain-containing protein [Thermoplasmata archaeon]|nr:OB-fold domain-containing protein [Thermoplasmata archaeon]
MSTPPPHSIAEFVRAYETGGPLRGFRCPRCRLVTATWGVACSRCGARPLEEAILSDRGRIVAGTIVAVASDEFVNDAPYAYVVVELDGGGRLSGWMPNVRTDEEIAPGTPVRFTPGYKPGVQFARLAPEAAEGSSQ